MCSEEGLNCTDPNGYVDHVLADLVEQGMVYNPMFFFCFVPFFHLFLPIYLALFSLIYVCKIMYL